MWNPEQYGRFRDERSKPFFDLLGLVQQRPGMRTADLRRLAEERRTSEAELIRAALTRFVESDTPPRPKLPLFRSSDPTLAEHVDEALTGFGD